MSLDFQIPIFGTITPDIESESTEGEATSTQGELFKGIEKSPKALVLLLLTPDYFVIFAYLLLFWQLISMYYDGHANLFKSVLQGVGKYFITVIGILLLFTQIAMILLYLDSRIKGSAFLIQLIILNFACPLIAVFVMFTMVLKFSGSPIKSSIYHQKLKLLQCAVIIWSLTRLLRGACGLFESELFYGMILGL